MQIVSKEFFMLNNFNLPEDLKTKTLKKKDIKKLKNEHQHGKNKQLDEEFIRIMIMKQMLDN